VDLSQPRFRDANVVSSDIKCSRRTFLRTLRIYLESTYCFDLIYRFIYTSTMEVVDE
jgi:hypothetical protein